MSDDYTAEELAQREAYWREQMADAQADGPSRAAELKARDAGAGGSAPTQIFE